MLFNSFEFVVFLSIVFLLYWFVFKKRRQQNFFVIIVSYLFYGWWDWRIAEILGETENVFLTKAILKPELEKGEKDVFLYNDTHWFFKSYRVVANEIYVRIKDMMNE